MNEGKGDRSTRGPTESSLLETTAHHPFWDATTGAWVDAADLVAGEFTLIGPDGQIQYVTEVRNHTGAKVMRDLTVADIHTYYVIVGNEPVLVHNNDDECPTAGKLLNDLQNSGGGEKVAVTARLDIDGKSYYGVNGHGQSYERPAGVMPQSMGHAEVDAVMQASAAGHRGGVGRLDVAGLIPCPFCRSSLAGLARHLDLDVLHVTGPNGYRGIYERGGGYRTIEWGGNPRPKRRRG